MPNDHIEYSERYVAFLDVLGFGDIVSDLKPDDHDRLNDIYWTLGAPKLLGMPKFDVLETTSFSDNVVASSPTTALGLRELLQFSYSFSWDMLRQGYLTRGAIVRGPLVHDQYAVFGRGLVAAYNMERTVARYARIVVAARVFREATEFSPTHVDLRRYLEHIAPAHDGPYYLNFLMPISVQRHDLLLHKPMPDAQIASPPEDEEYRTQIRSEVRRIIEGHLDRATDDPHKFEKVKWLAEEFNRCATADQWPHERISVYGSRE